MAGLVVGVAPAAGAERAHARRVVIVSYPRLDWATVVEAQPPELLAFVRDAAVASLAVRTAGATTGLGDGYATISAGNPAAADPAVAGAAIPASGGADSGGGAVVPGFEAIDEAADDALFGAEPGALGQALANAGRTVAVIGNADIEARDDEGTIEHREVALAGMDRAGRVAAGRVDPGLSVTTPGAPGGRTMDTAGMAAALDAVWPAAALVVVEVSDLERLEQAGGSGDATDARAAALARGDDLLAAVRARAGPDDLVLVVAPAAAGDARGLTVVAAAGAGLPAGGAARTGTTRRDGYVTLPDLAVTTLDALGVPIPDSMNGNPLVAAGGPANDLARLRAVVDDDERAHFRDRAVGPVSVVFVAGQVLTYAVALWCWRRSSRLPAGVVLAGLVLMAMPVVGFVAGLVPYRHLGLVGFTLAVPAVALLLALAVRPLAHIHRYAPPLVLAALTLGVLVLDVATGAHLQLDTVFGYSPTVAGRFAGFGNLAFALVGATAVVVAAGLPAVLAPPGATAADPVRDRRLALAAAVLGVAVLADGLPALGSDLGGALTLVPAAAAVLLVLGRWRITPARVGLAAAATVAVVVAMAALDLARPPDARTHIGRFAARVLDGDAGIVVRRKLAANWAIFTSSVWTLLLPVVVALLVVLATHPRSPLTRLRHHVVGVEAGLLGAAVVAGLGFALNDSGVAVPAMMLAVIVPWLLWLLDVDPPPSLPATAAAAALPAAQTRSRAA